MYREISCQTCKNWKASDETGYTGKCLTKCKKVIPGNYEDIFCYNLCANHEEKVN